jgi:alpha-beta hydrolase superfamily lysophospholipase
MGSFLCQRFHQLYGNHINGLILSATNGIQDPLMNAGIAIAYVQMKIFGKNHRSSLLNMLSFEKFNKAFKPNRTTLDWLSVNESNVDEYINDPKCGFISSSTLFYYFLKGLKDIFNPAYIKRIPSNVPVYLFAGDRDPVGMFGKGFLQLYENWKANAVEDISFTLYKDGRHEMLNEINSVEVVGNVIEWINNHS